MSWLSRILRYRGMANERAAAWRALPDADLSLPHDRARYVVIDVETTGLDLRRDRIIAIGAVAVNNLLIDFSDCIEVLLKQETVSPTANILIHGIGGQAQLSGLEPAEGLLDFLNYLGESPLVAFRAEFDQTMLTRAVTRALGDRLRHPWMDLAWYLPALYPNAGCESLDDWLTRFNVSVFKRHHALGDAFATAQLLQIVLRTAEQGGMKTARQLGQMERAQKWPVHF